MINGDLEWISERIIMKIEEIKKDDPRSIEGNYVITHFNGGTTIVKEWSILGRDI